MSACSMGIGRRTDLTLTAGGGWSFGVSLWRGLAGAVAYEGVFLRVCLVLAGVCWRWLVVAGASPPAALAGLRLLGAHHRRLLWRLAGPCFGNWQLEHRLSWPPPPKKSPRRPIGDPA